MSSPYPDDLASRDWYDDLLGKGKGDFDMPSIRFIGQDKAVVEYSDGDVHWSELPKPVREFRAWELGDNNKGSAEQNLEEE